jgi:hypothetical protein
VELRDARVRGGVLAVTEALRGSHGPSALQGEGEINERKPKKKNEEAENDSESV